MTATPVWQVDEWSLTASLTKLEQQWTAVREILEDHGLCSLSDTSVSGWSCGEHAGHITMVNYWIAEEIASNLQEPDRHADRKWTEHTAPILEAGDFPRGVAQAPPEVDPLGRPRDEFLRLLPAAVRNWKTLYGQGERLAECPGRFSHFALGYMTSSEWARFCAIHTAHHFAVVRDIRGGAA